MKTNASRTSKSTVDNAMLALTPMIDVVFLLLIFFVVTLKQNDITAQLDALRPMPSGIPGPDPLTISIGSQGLYYNGAIVTESRLRENMTRIQRMDPSIAVVIKCAEDSAHGTLVRALDICNEVGLRKIALFSM